jgi:hypothetical protein
VAALVTDRIEVLLDSQYRREDRVAEDAVSGLHRFV